jgi:hypothetical protein
MYVHVHVRVWYLRLYVQSYGETITLVHRNFRGKLVQNRHEDRTCAKPSHAARRRCHCPSIQRAAITAWTTAGISFTIFASMWACTCASACITSLNRETGTARTIMLCTRVCTYVRGAKFRSQSEKRLKGRSVDGRIGSSACVHRHLRASPVPSTWLTRRRKTRPRTSTSRAVPSVAARSARWMFVNSNGAAHLH